MRTTRRRAAALIILAALAVAAALIIANRPGPGHEFFAAYRDIYPGTPASAEAEFIATAERICEAGAPASWWEAWDNGAPSRADFWRLAVVHMCPEHSDRIPTP